MNLRRKFDNSFNENLRKLANLFFINLSYDMEDNNGRYNLSGKL